VRARMVTGVGRLLGWVGLCWALPGVGVVIGTERHLEARRRGGTEPRGCHQVVGTTPRGNGMLLGTIYASIASSTSQFR